MKVNNQVMLETIQKRMDAIERNYANEKVNLIVNETRVVPDDETSIKNHKDKITGFKNSMDELEKAFNALLNERDNIVNEMNGETVGD